MKKARLEYGLHPFFYCIKDDLHKLILLAKELDSGVHYTPGKMARIKGITPRIKIAPHNTRPKFVFLKLYGHKVVQSFFIEFSSSKLVDQFIYESKSKFPDQFVD